MLFNEKSFWFVVFFFLIQMALNAQTFSIEGAIREVGTNEPIAGAQIFLNGTTIGTTSNKDGEFRLNNIPDGIYELNVSLLGFENVSTTINTNSLAPYYNFLLEEKIYEMDQVTIRPNLKEWKENFEEFRKNFIGSGPFSDNTKIKNPEILSFDFDPYEKTLTATAYGELLIENKDLGYLIIYYLDLFEINYGKGSSLYFGRPFFQPLSSRRKSTKKKWLSNREVAYQGSFLHFTKALIKGNSRELGYISKGEKREEKARYISKDEIDPSLYFYPVDSTTYMFKFINFINIANEAEEEDKTYLSYIWNPLSRNPRTLVQNQVSSFTLTQDSVLIDKSGYIFDPLAVLLDGYWSFERVSDMMPLDYVSINNVER